MFDEEIEVAAPVEEGIVEAEAAAMEEAPGETDVEIDGVTEAPETVRRLTIVPEPMKIPGFEEDEGDDEEGNVLIEGTDRERYEELHLRLTTTQVQALVNNGVTEIVYELEKAQLALPLASLTSEIQLPEEEEFEDDSDSEAELEEELEIEDGIEVDNSMAFGASMDELEMVEDEFSEDASTIVVEGYDIVIEQADADGLTPGELALIADNQKLTNPYRVRVHIIPEGAEQVPTGELDKEDQPITVPTTDDVELKVSLNDSYMTTPEGVNVLYASPAASEAVPEETAETLEEDGEATEFETAEGETTEGAAAEGETPADQTLTGPLATGEATLTPAVLDDEDDPIKVVITPVTDGTYIAVAPPEWDASLYLEDVADDDFETDDTIGEDGADEQELEFEDDEEI